MAKFCKIIFKPFGLRSTIILGLIVLGSYGAYQFLSINYSYSETPDLALQKFASSILKKDEKNLRRLFVSQRGYDSCMNVPVDSEGSRLSKTPLKRIKGQLAMDAWHIWFAQYGRTYLRFTPLPSGIGMFSPLGNDAFSIYTIYTSRGYLIRDCAFSL